MASANGNIQVTDLDFINIKNNLKQFLQGQDTLKDYNYEGSALSVLLDVLAYNTQYNAYYLNMVANEMFLDTALLRSSVISKAKELNYTPKSAIAPTATVNLTVHQVNDSSLTIPKFTRFLSEAVNGVNYNFVTTDSVTVNTGVNKDVYFPNLEIKQGIPASSSFVVNSTTNPSYTFALYDKGIDTTTLTVSVQQSNSNSSYEIYTLCPDFTTLDISKSNTEKIYFLQESVSNPTTYEIYFGDGIIGNKLSDGNVVNITYIKTDGTLSAGANNFSLMGSISGYANTTLTSVTSASTGGDIESIQSIKFQAPKSYATQGRAVTSDDYVTIIQQNKLGYSFDSVSVWGGEKNDPPVYGQVFIALKPSGAYALTDTQKQRLINEVIKPISVITVEPTIVEPDYNYIKVNTNVNFDSKKTNLTSNQIQNLVKSAINNFSTSTLNTFNSTFVAPDLSTSIQSVDNAILSNETTIQLQKKFFPNLSSPETYNFYFGVPLQKGMFQSGVSSSPSMSFVDPTNVSVIIDGIYLEEVPASTAGIESIKLINPGFGYEYAPTVTILGDGTGATAVAKLNTSGSISSIQITNSGSGYTSAIVSIVPNSKDKKGKLGAAIVKLQGQYGTLRLYYNNDNNVKTIFNDNVGTIDYVNGIVTLDQFNPLDVDNPLGQLSLTVNPLSTIVSSTYNRIITIDPFDPNAITVNVTTK